MDAFVEEKLIEWNSIEFRDNFIDNCIDEEAFKLLTLESVKELIPILGPRLKFWSFYEKFKEQEDYTTKLVDEPITEKQRAEVPGVRGVGRNEDSRTVHRGAKAKVHSSLTNYAGAICNNIKSGSSTSVKNLIMGGEKNKLSITTKKVYEDRSKLKSTIPWKDLGNEYRKQLMSKPLMVLQGESQNKISLETLLGSVNAAELEGLIDDFTLYKLIEDIDIDLGVELPGLGETEAYFIARTFLGHQSREIGEMSLVDLINDMGHGETTIICDDAGTGKSVILKVIAREMKALFPNRWFIFVNLRSYASVFEKQLDSLVENDSSDIINKMKSIAVDFFVFEMYNAKNKEIYFERNLLKWCLEISGGVVLLFDGFDEICSKYENIVKGLFFGLKNSRVENLIVTTRTHSAGDLEMNLKACSYQMRPFNEEDKRNFIVKYWIRYSDCDNRVLLEDKANRLIEIFSWSIIDNESRFMGIPLQCRLLAEIYRVNLDSSDEWETISLYKLYEQFSSIKFQEEENKYRSTTSTGGAENNALTIIRVREYHWESAFRLLLGENVVRKLNFQRVDNYVEECLLKKVERVGIMTETGQSPVFIHRTFAEFSIAEFFIKSLERHEGDAFWEVMEIWMGNVSKLYRGNMNLVPKFFESGLKDRKVGEETFRQIQTSILKSWQLDSLDIFYKFRDYLRLLVGYSTEMEYEKTYRFLLRCIIFDGNMPMDLLSLVTVAVPLPFGCSAATEIFLQFISSFPNNVQEIITLHILYRANETLRQKLGNSFTSRVMAFPGMLVTSDSLREKMTLFENFLEASAAGDVDNLSKLLREVGDNENGFWLLNGGINNDCNGTSAEFYYYQPQNRDAYISPLISAINNNQQTALKFLLDRGAAPNPPINSDFSPPLFRAIQFGNLKSLKILLKRGADKDYKHDDETPLDFACRCGKTELVSCLLDFGCERKGSIALHWAVKEGDTDLLRLLLDRGFDVNQRDYYQATPLHFSVVAMCNKPAHPVNITRILLHYGADIEARNRYGTTALHIAAQYGAVRQLQTTLSEICIAEGNFVYSQKPQYRKQLVEFLLACGADIQAKDNYGKSPLHFVRDPRTVLVFLVNGADIEAADSKGRTPLHLAVSEGETQVISILIERGANVEAKDNSRRTPLHRAVIISRTSNHETVRLLLRHGADASARDEDGKTPLQLAIVKWDNDVEPLSFPAKKAGVAQKRPATSSLEESFQMYTRIEISEAISERLEGCKGDWTKGSVRDLALTILLLLEHEPPRAAK